MNTKEIKTRELFGNLVQQYFKKGVGAEIGVEYGINSAKILSQWKGSLVCVDMWGNQDAFNKASALLKDRPATLIRENSLAALKRVMDGSLDFVYIDANHDYNNCKQDLEAWFPKVRHGGIVAGHDYLTWEMTDGAACPFGVKEAVDEFCVKHGYKLHVTTDDFWQGNPYQTWWFVKEIPRIIYYTWVSPDPLPAQFQKYINGWKVLMPDYEIRQISLNNVIKSPFVMEAIKRGLYAVAGHYGRCERLLETGGIYFDIDIEAVKRFDELLDLEFFVACEKPYRVNNAVIGSAPGHPFLKECISFMDHLVFHDPGPMGIEIETGPEMFTRIAKKYGWKESSLTQNLQDLTVFAPEYFYPYYFDEHYAPGCATPQTYAIHHWAKTWIK